MVFAIPFAMPEREASLFCDDFAMVFAIALAIALPFHRFSFPFFPAFERWADISDDLA
jgi:hypothetical protein